MISSSIALSLMLLATAGDDGSADTWPQWRGPARDGQFTGPEWAMELGDESLAESWRVEDLGPSYSGPVVSGRRVFTTSTVGERDEVVTAFDRATGEKIWEVSWAGAMEVPFFAARNGSWIKSTPACDGEALFVAGMRDVLVCLSADTGEERWSLDLAKELETPNPDFGFVCSPLVEGEHVYVQAGMSFIKVDKRSGAIVWRSLTDAPGMHSQFSSPLMAEIAGRPQLLVQTREALVGVDPEQGGALWSIPVKTFRGMNILTPLVVGDSVFTAAYGGRAQRIEITAGENGFTAEQAWDSGSQGYMTSPVLIDGHAYFFTRSNRFTCLDLETGEERWTSPPTGDEYWSLIAQGERILALSNTGRLYLLAANPEEYQVLDEREVSEEESWAHLAAAGDQLFIRSQTSLIAYDWK